MMSTSQGHCVAAGRSSLQCNHSAVSDVQGNSRWWEGGRLVWSGTSSPPPPCSKSWALSEVQTAAGLHTQTYTQTQRKNPHSKDKCMYPEERGTNVAVVGGGGKHRGVIRNKRKWAKWKGEDRKKEWRWRCKHGEKKERREGRKKQEKSYFSCWHHPLLVIRHADCGTETVCDQHCPQESENVS